jgi:predicted transcriptional regulator
MEDKIINKTNSENFLNSFNEIEHYLRKVTNEVKETSFYALIDKASLSNSAVKHFKDDLKEFADLRNAIIHERTDNHVIAEPNDRTVRELNNIALLLLQPPKVSSFFRNKVFKLFSKDPIAKAVEFMYVKSFSQVPIYEDKNFIGLLTSNTIARWLGASVRDDIFSLEETSISMVLKEYTEDKDNCEFLNRTATLFDVLKKFQEYETKGKRLDAILITANGKPDEELLGIITVWDLTSVYREIERHN